MVNFKVAIPSYNRAGPLVDYTLSTILSKNIDPSCIDIFVANEDEYHTYKKTIPADMYNEIIITEKGKMNAINHIRRFYRKGQKLLNFDDDVSEIYYGYNHYNVPLNDVKSYSEYIFKNMKKHKVPICGIIQTNGAMAKKHLLSINNYEIYGYMYWSYNDPSPQLDLYLDNCEDIEFGLKNFDKYGKVMITREVSIRNESIQRGSTLTRLAEYEDMANARQKIAKEFPHLVEIHPLNKSPKFPYPIKFKKPYKTISIPTVVKKW